MDFPDAIACYQAIGAALAGAAPKDWSTIQANIVLAGSRIGAVVSYQAAHGSGHLTGVPMLARHFYQLARLVSSEDKGLFKACTFKLERSGKYDVDFTY